MKRSLRYALAFACLIAAPMPHDARAITTNPIEPTQPLTVHASAFCAESNGSVTGEVTATCFQENEAEGTALPLERVIGTSESTVDLTTGTLRATATSQTLADGVNALHAGGFVVAKLYDTITILNIPFNQTVPVVLQMTVHGAFTSTESNPNTQDTDVSDVLNGFTDTQTIGDTGIEIIRGNNGTPFVNSQTNIGSGTTTSNAVNQVFGDPGDIQFVSTITFIASSAAPTFTFTAQLAAESGLGFTDVSPDPKNSAVDFGNTARLQLLLPDGVTFSSASGQFLQNVPEPETLLLVALGVAALLLRRAATHFSSTKSPGFQLPSNAGCCGP